MTDVTDTVLADYIDNPNRKLAKIIAKQIKNFSSKQKFQTMEVKKLYKIFDKCDELDSEFVYHMLCGLFQHQLINVNECLNHLKTNKSAVQKMFETQHTINSPRISFILNQHQDKIEYLCQSICKVEELEKICISLATRVSYIQSCLGHSTDQSMNTCAMSVPKSNTEPSLSKQKVTLIDFDDFKNLKKSIDSLSCKLDDQEPRFCGLKSSKTQCDIDQLRTALNALSDQISAMRTRESSVVSGSLVNEYITSDSSKVINTVHSNTDDSVPNPPIVFNLHESESDVKTYQHDNHDSVSNEVALHHEHYDSASKEKTSQHVTHRMTSIIMTPKCEGSSLTSNQAVHHPHDYIYESEERISKVEEDIYESKGQVSKLKKEVLESKERVSRLEVTVLESNERVLKLEVDARESKERVYKLLDDTLEYKERISSIEKEVKKLSSQVSSIRDITDQLNENRSVHDENTRELTNQINILQSKILNLSSTSLSNENGIKLHKIDSMEKTLNSISNQLVCDSNTQNNVNMEQSRRIDDLECAIDNLERAISDNLSILEGPNVKKFIEEQNAKIETIEKNLTSLANQFSYADIELDLPIKDISLVNKVSKLELGYNQLMKQIQTLKSTSNELDFDMDLVDFVTRLSKKFEDLELQVKENRQKVTKKLKDISNDNKEFRVDLDSMRSKINERYDNTIYDINQVECMINMIQNNLSTQISGIQTNVQKLNEGYTRNQDEIWYELRKLQNQLIVSNIPTKPTHLNRDIIDVCKRGDLDSLKFILYENRSEVNRCDVNNGGTPLIYASMNGHRDLVRFLLANGADVNAKNKLGNTALHCASWNGYKDICELLVRFNADINSKGDGIHYLFMIELL